MEKLIELLNEYEKIAPSRLQRKYYSESWHIMYIDEEWEDVDDYRTDYEIISKEYGFIKWLVENNKIDVSYKKHWENRPYKLHQFSGKAEKYSPYDTMLMLLAIQDEPIEFLISILK